MVLFSFWFSTRPSHRTRARTIPFESGVSTGPPAQQRFTISFYLTAMLFIVFDIEIVFLYPLAVALNDLGWFAFFELIFFVVILAVAYVYIWRRVRSNGGEAPPRLRAALRAAALADERPRRLRAGDRRRRPGAEAGPHHAREGSGVVADEV